MPADSHSSDTRPPQNQVPLVLRPYRSRTPSCASSSEKWVALSEGSSSTMLLTTLRSQAVRPLTMVSAPGEADSPLMRSRSWPGRRTGIAGGGGHRSVRWSPWSTGCGTPDKGTMPNTARQVRLRAVRRSPATRPTWTFSATLIRPPTRRGPLRRPWVVPPATPRLAKAWSSSGRRRVMGAKLSRTARPDHPQLS